MDLGEGDTSKVQSSQHDVLSAMIEWVENNEPPEKLVATAWTDDRKPGQVFRQRPLCMWPKQAKFKGGDEKKAESWSCEGLY